MKRKTAPNRGLKELEVVDNDCKRHTREKGYMHFDTAQKAGQQCLFCILEKTQRSSNGQ